MNKHSLLDFQVSREEISSAFAPFVRRHFQDSDIRWKLTIFKSWRKKFRDYLQYIWFSKSKRSFGGAQHKVKAAYEEFWGATLLREHLGREGHASPCIWGNDRMLARGIGTKRVHLILLKRAMEIIKPKSVLEVGCGYGINLFLLAGYYPEIHFSGVEMTKQGTVAAKAIGRTYPLPKEILEFAQYDLVDVGAHQRIKFFQGSAMKLPFLDKSFDVIYTVHALEAMEEIRHQALKELARVARKYVIMIEPFLDFNNRGIRYYYHASHQYFRGKVDELPQDGLEPHIIYSDIPHKIRLRPALVIARPIQSNP